MPRKMYWILAAAGVGMGWTLLAVAVLLYGNEWWLSGLTTLTVFAWLGGLLVVAYQQGRVRAAALGAVVAAFVYWLLALGPWFSTNVGPTLLTSRVLYQVDLLLHGNQPPVLPQVLATPQPASAYWSLPVYTNTGIVVSNPPIAQPSTIYTTVASPPSPVGTASIFQTTGQWLAIWLCAAIGGCAALLMQMRAEKRKRPEPAETAGESPFAPVVKEPSAGASP